MDRTPTDPDEERRYDAWSDALEGAIEKAMPGADRSEGYGTMISYALGGGDPLRFVFTIPRDHPEPHWLYVSKGLSDPELDVGIGGASGFGFEFTFRVPRDPAATSPLAPVEFVVMLQSLARYVFDSGNVFVDGDYLQLEPGETTLGGLTGTGFLRDPELGPVDTGTGTIEFRSIVGLRADELDAIKTWSTYGLVDLAVAAGKLSPNRITHPGRASFLTDPAFAASVVEGGARDGSRTGALFTQTLTLEAKTRLFRAALTTLVASEADLRQVLAVLPNRIAFERALTLSGRSARVRFEPADEPAIAPMDGGLRVGLPPASVTEFVRAFRDGARRYEFPGLPLAVEMR